LEILGEKLNLVKLLCLELLLIGLDEGDERRKPLVIVPSRLKRRIKALKRVMGEECQAKSPEERYDLYKRAYPAILEYLLYQGRADLFQDAEKFIRMTGTPPIRGERIVELRPDLEGARLGRVIDEVKKGVFTGRIGDMEDAESFVLQYKI